MAKRSLTDVIARLLSDGQPQTPAPADRPAAIRHASLLGDLPVYPLQLDPATGRVVMNDLFLTPVNSKTNDP